MKGKKIETDTKQRVIEMRAEGKTCRDIAEVLGIGKTAVADIIGDSREAVATLEGMRLETLYQTARVTHEARIEALGLLRTKLLDEVKKRDLADVPTKDLITLLLNVDKAAMNEVLPLEILSEYEQNSRQEARYYGEFAFSSK